MNFKVFGLPEDTVCEFKVSDRYFERALDNTITTLTDTFDYIQPGVLTTAAPRTRIDASMTMYNLTEDKQMPFVLYEQATGKEIFSGDLIDMIESAYSSNGQTVDFGTTFEFDIELNFGGGVKVTVSVNGWTYTPDDVDL